MTKFISWEEQERAMNINFQLRQNRNYLALLEERSEIATSFDEGLAIKREEERIQQIILKLEGDLEQLDYVRADHSSREEDELSEKLLG